MQKENERVWFLFCGWMHLIALLIFVCFCSFFCSMCLEKTRLTNTIYAGRCCWYTNRTFEHWCLRRIHWFIANKWTFKPAMSVKQKKNNNNNKFNWIEKKIQFWATFCMYAVHLPRWRTDRSTSRIAGCRSIICIVDIMHNGWRNLFDWRLYFGWYSRLCSSFST